MSNTTKISDTKLKKLIKETSAKKVIYMHIAGKITLSSKQLDYVLSLEHERF